MIEVISSGAFIFLPRLFRLPRYSFANRGIVRIIRVYGKKGFCGDLNRVNGIFQDTIRIRVCEIRLCKPAVIDRFPLASIRNIPRKPEFVRKLSGE